MLDEQIITTNLRLKGFKVTNARTRIIQIFETYHVISAPEIITLIKSDRLSIHKSTVYREIDFLLRQNIIRQLEFRERDKKYELVSKRHHHHLICISCKKVIEFELEEDWSVQEQKVSKEKNFQVLDHSLEFFGLCVECKKSESAS